MNPRTVTMIAVVGIGAVALAFRLSHLEIRPMHADESVQAARTAGLWLEGKYRYDPDEFHGPTLSYATLAVLWISPAKSFAQTTKNTYRLVPVIFGVASLCVIWLLRDGLGRSAVAWAGLLMAISPAAVFYSRYYIHESLLAFFTIGAVGCGWRAWHDRKTGWFIAAGICIGLMQSTKETAVLTYATAIAAGVLTWLWNRLPGSSDTPPRPGVKPLALAAAAAFVVTVILLSSFFTNLRGPWDGVMAYLPWFARAGGESPHIHPWHFYLHRLVYWQVLDGPLWSEAILFALGTVGLVTSLLSHFVARLRRDEGSTEFNATLVQWLGFHTLLLTAVYCIIPYKTPWCMLQFLVGWYLLAGYGASVIVRKTPTALWRSVVVLLLLVPCLHLAWQAYRASFQMASDYTNPYVYAQSVTSIEKLGDEIDSLAETLKTRNNATVYILWNDPYYWPLPWYLRRCSNVVPWSTLPDQDLTQIPVIVSSAKFDQVLIERLSGSHIMIGFFGVRPDALAQIWVEDGLWIEHLKRRGLL